MLNIFYFAYGTITRPTLVEHVIDILYSHSSAKLDREVFEFYLGQLPLAMQQGVSTYMRWQDAQLNLLGKILLLKGLEAGNGDKHQLEKMQYTKFNRPYLPGELDFNISHAGDIVVCAIAKGYRVGIDIEKIKPISTEDYVDQFTKEEFLTIATAVDQLREFYTRWTKKEAVIKADGKGLSIALKDIYFKNSLCAQVENFDWHLHTIEIDQEYACHLATDCKKEDCVRVQKITLAQ